MRTLCIKVTIIVNDIVVIVIIMLNVWFVFIRKVLVWFVFVVVGCVVVIRTGVTRIIIGIIYIIHMMNMFIIIIQNAFVNIYIYSNKISIYNIIKLISLLLLNIKLLQYTKNQINFLNKNYHLQNRKVFLMIPYL